MLPLRWAAAEPEMPLWRADVLEELHRIDTAKYHAAVLNIKDGYDNELIARELADRHGFDSSDVDRAWEQGAPLRDARARERLRLKPDYKRAEAMLAQNWPKAPDYRKAADGLTMIGTGDLFMEYGRAVRNIARELGLHGNNYICTDENVRQEAGKRYSTLCGRIAGTSEIKIDTLDVLYLGMIEEALGLHMAYCTGLKYLYDAIEIRSADEFRQGQEIVAKSRNRKWQIRISPNVASMQKSRRVQ